MNQEPNIIDVNEEDFNEKVIEASNKKLVIVDFWAPWCGPCKQLTPILEKIIKSTGDKIILVKVNIDENQQIAAQLRIQSIPTVYAFKDKQIVNAFQGVLPEKKIMDFLEKSLGSKLNEDFTEFYNQIKHLISDEKFDEAKEALIEFIGSNPTELEAMTLYLECLISLEKFQEFTLFIESLEKKIVDKDEIKQIIKKMDIIKNNQSGPKIDDLISKLKKKPNDINLVIEVADKYFSLQRYDESMNLLLKHYPKNKDKVKEKMKEFFEILGIANEYTVKFRKQLSQIMFS